MMMLFIDKCEGPFQEIVRSAPRSESLKMAGLKACILLHNHDELSLWTIHGRTTDSMIPYGKTHLIAFMVTLAKVLAIASVRAIHLHRDSHLRRCAGVSKHDGAQDLWSTSIL